LKVALKYYPNDVTLQADLAEMDSSRAQWRFFSRPIYEPSFLYNSS
jgi:hypothetical protein